jgi:DNA-binding NtrC family response regulator
MKSTIIRLVTNLKSAGLTEEQAVLQARSIAQLIDERLASNRYLRELEIRFEAKLGELKTEIIKQILPSAQKQADPLVLDVPPDGINLDRTMNRIEKDLILKALQRGKELKKAAALLNLSYEALRYRMEKHGIDRDLTEIQIFSLESKD